MSAMATGWDSDERLLADLGAALRAEREVPERFLEIGREAFAWYDVDAELAALTFDSARGDAVPAGTRADTASLRALTFAARQLTVELEVTADALVGQVVPPQPGELEVRPRQGEARTVPIDDVGWFSIRPRPSGLFRLHLRTAEGDVLTEWITL
jgi:hypothetical protein